MIEIIDEIFGELKEEIKKAKDLEPTKFPVLEEGLVPFILREVTPEEAAFITLRVNNANAAEAMYARVQVLTALGFVDEVAATAKEDELIRVKAEMLENLFFWYILKVTGWKYSAILQGMHEGKLVIVAMTSKQAREYFDKKEETPSKAVEPRGSVLVN